MAEGITRIAVKGFKSISKRQSIDIAPLTILAGANSSGKSSIMQPLLLLKQTLELVSDPGPLWVGGPNVKFTSSDQFFSRAAKATGRLSLEIATPYFEFHITFAKGLKFAAEVLEESEIRKNRVVTLRPAMTSKEIRKEMERAYGDAYSAAELSLVPDRFFLDVDLSDGTTFHAVKQVARFIQSVIHVPGIRGNPERDYPVRVVGTTFPGTFADYTASVVDKWQTHQSPENDGLNADLKAMGLAPEVRARRLSDIQIELVVKRLGDSNDAVHIADVGFGVSQTLPVLVALRAASEGQLVYLEEPEIHLHPRAQVKLADILACAAKRGVRVVAETHSSLLLRAFQTLVAKGDLAPGLVRMHWFSRDKGGMTQVNSATPDQNGALGDWPEDFGDVALESEKEYLDAVETKLAR